ncbi:beta propeller repeat protein [Chitinophaga ginsengisoli]|nr:hypothetical protein [Chitinophaga ginsengisoli]
MKITIRYSNGFAENAQTARVICHIGDEPYVQPALAKWGGPKEKWSMVPMKWIPVSVVVLPAPNPCVFTLSTDGTIGFGYGDYKEEQIDSSDEGPKSRGPLRELRVIDGQVYATGMGRQVYRRSAAGKWTRIDEGVGLARGVIEVAGFNSIDGVNENDCWAAGFLGEIWHYNGAAWKKQESGTRLNLHKVVAVQSNQVYCVGQKGQVLKYGGNSWQVIHNNAAIGDLWDAAWYDNTLYIATDKALYRLQNDQQLEAVVVDGINSFGHLHVADGTLWSFGTRQVASTGDGTNWITLPGFI